MGRDEPADRNDEAPLFDGLPPFDALPPLECAVHDELPIEPLSEQALAAEITRMLRDGEIPY
jgi:hypothetical protein